MDTKNNSNKPIIRINRFLNNLRGEKNSQNTKINKINGEKWIKKTDNLNVKTYVEPSKEIQVRYDNIDVLVIGGGPAGLAAAVSAKTTEKDLKVLIVEKEGCFGGTITNVGMESIYWYKYEGCSDLGGFGEYLENVAETLNSTTKFPYNSSTCLETEKFKVVADKIIQDNGIIPLLHTMATDVIIENGVMKGVIFESKSGRFVIYSKRFIDATGDGDIAFMANCDMSILPVDERMGITKVFNVKSLNREKFKRYITENPSTYKDWSGSESEESEFHQHCDGKEEHLKSPYFKNLNTVLDNGQSSIDGTWSTITKNNECLNLNLVHFKNVDGLKVEDLTKCEIEGRKNTELAIRLLKEKIPGFENIELRNFSSTVGVRDTRKLIGVYNLTEDDVYNDARFSDAVGSFVRFIDGYSRLVLPTDGRRFQIPIRSLISKNVKNLMVCGRCIAGDRVSHASTRNMGCCFVTGQSAGISSSISLLNGCYSTDYNNLQFIENIKKECIKQNMVI